MDFTSLFGMDLASWSLTTFAGVAAAVWGLLELLKTRFKWVDGIEEYLAVVMPMAVVACMKWWHLGYAGNSWGQALLGALGAGLASQVAHDKLPAAWGTLLGHAKSLWFSVTGK